MIPARRWRRSLSRLTLRALLLRLLAGPLVALLILALVETGLRLSGAEPAWTAQHGLGWRLSPRLDGPMPVMPGQDPFTVRTNADGLRTALPREHSGTVRFALLGDSTVFGWGADEGGAPADGLQAGLAGWLSPDGHPADVLNAGMPGYSTVQAAWLYKNVVAAYSPQVVIYFPSLHDHNSVMLSDRLLLAQMEDRADPLARSRIWLIQQSRLYQFLRQRLFSLSARPMLTPGQQEPDRMPRVSDAERAEALAALHADLTAAGARLLIGWLPQALDLQRAPDSAAPRLGEPWMDAFRAAHDIQEVDARGCCVGRREYLLPKDPGHLTAAGNLQAGQTLAAQIRNPGYRFR